MRSGSNRIHIGGTTRENRRWEGLEQGTREEGYGYSALSWISKIGRSENTALKKPDLLEKSLPIPAPSAPVTTMP